MDIQQEDSVKIVETKLFAVQADLLLSDVEKDALFGLLGREPMRGSSGEHPRILTLEWGRQYVLLIDYAVSPGFDEIYMLSIVEKDAASGVPDKDIQLKIKENISGLSGFLANISGAGTSIQSIIESIKSIYDMIKSFFN